MKNLRLSLVIQETTKPQETRVLSINAIIRNQALFFSNLHSLFIRYKTTAVIDYSVMVISQN